ncbi:MAG: aldehyde dehydrogenase [Chloroflexi bacterium]|nr:aldehyde dehydrogenase [Chloroflexota bacterium]
MFINGQPVDASDQQVGEIRNPASGEPVDTAPKGTAQDARAAIDAAHAAREVWRETDPSRRGGLLGKAAQQIAQNERGLAALLTREQGKPFSESAREIQRFVHTLEYYAGLGKNLRGGYLPLDNGAHGLIMKLPLGVCAAIVPWNFPISLLGNKIAPGLLCGNTFVVKPAGSTPLTTIRVIALMHACGFPDGVLNIVTGSGSVVGQELLTNPKVRKVGFTGASDTGRHVMRAAAETIKHVTLELGGSDPMIVAADADIDEAVSAASVGRFYNCGQACLAIKRLYLFDEIYESFLDKLAAKAKRLTVGDPFNERTRLGPMHSQAQRAEIEEQVSDALARGGKAVVGGARPAETALEKGYYYQPTLLVDAPLDARVATEETFGPVLPVWRVTDMDHAIELANHSIYGLGSSVWTRSISQAMKAAERIEAGYTWINQTQIIYDELPFGGVKQSGLGKEHGTEALDYYTETKSVVMAK